MPLIIDLAIECQAWRTRLGAREAIESRTAGAIAAAQRELACVDHLAPDDVELSILLCDDAFIRTLNAQWRGLDKPTNVLSFPATTAARRLTLGDIAVAFETSAREAEARGVSLDDHLCHLVVHGFLHLLGFDHEDEDEAERMEALETRILAALGIASPFTGAPDHGSRKDAAEPRATLS